MSKRAPSGVTVPVRRATRPSTASSDERDGRERHQGRHAASGRANESATSAATPPTRVARGRASPGRPGPAAGTRASQAAGPAARPVASRAGEADDPAGGAETDASRPAREQGQLADEPDRRAGLNRTHRASVCPGYDGQYEQRDGSGSLHARRGRREGEAGGGATRARSGCASPVSARSARRRCPSPGPDDVLVRTLRSGVSRGTETLVFRGGVPASQYAAMRAPFQEGDFPGPVKYGYLNVGVVEQRPAGAARPHRLLPLPAPDRLRGPGPRRDRRARRRAAGAGGAGRHRGDGRQRAVGRGTAGRRPGHGRRRRHGRLLRRAAAAPAFPGVRVTLVDVDPTRADVAARARRRLRAARRTRAAARTSSCTPAPRPPGSSGRSTCSRRRAPSST